MKQFYTVLIALLLLTFTSCRGKEQPSDPVNLLSSLDVAKVELVVIEGHLHGTYGFHETADPADQVYMKRFNKYVYNRQSDGSMVIDPKGTTKLCAVGGTRPSTGHATHEEELGAVYGMWIHYFDTAGKDVTQQVLGGANGKRLQHFFTAKDIKPTFDGTQAAIDERKSQEKFMTYLYCDTDPLTNRIKDGAKVSGKTNPIGHKGYFGFCVPRSQFTLEIVLSDLRSKGKPLPFYAHPSSADNLMTLSLPVIVYAHSDEELEEEEVDEFSESDRKYLQSIANAYGITMEQALKACLNRLYGDVPPHSDNGYWF